MSDGDKMRDLPDIHGSVDVGGVGALVPRKQRPSFTFSDPSQG